MRAFVFPGQGSQFPGMGQSIAEAYSAAREVFEEADDVLGFSLSRLCFEGPEEKLVLTENTQPALLAASVAVFRVLEKEDWLPDFVAGHSLGEYSALVAAGALSLADGLRLVRRRGEFMQKAVPVGVGAMAAVIGLDLSEVTAVCDEAAEGQVVSPANQNSPQQVAIAGHQEAVERASRLAKERGARRVLPLPVSAPFHCELMKPAEKNMVPLLESVEIKAPVIPIVNNVDARLVKTAEEVRDGLIRQICSMVRWTEDIEKLSELGVQTFVEVGPGRVLTGLIRKISPDAQWANIEKPEQVEENVQAG